MKLNLSSLKLHKLIPAFLAIVSVLVPVGLKRQRDEAKRLHDMPMAQAMVEFSEAPLGFREELIQE